MRHIYKLAAFGLAGLFLTGCADTTIDYYQVDKPQSIADYEYLDAYGSLKDYIDRAAHPKFLLGTGVSATDYINKGLVYRLTNANFDMMTAGNEMKYASIVKDNGDMDFSTVEAFVDAAEAANMQIYGHTLCWHSQQNVKWLNSLIADREMEIDPDAFDDVTDKLVTYSDFTDYPYYVMWDVPKIENGLLVIDNTEPKGANWEGQYFVIDGATFTKGADYLVTAKLRGSEPGTLAVVAGDWGGNVSTDLEFTTEWKEVEVELKGVPAESGFVIFQSGACPGKLEVEWVKLHHHAAPVMEIPVSVINGGDADNGETESLISREPGQADYPSKVVDDPAGTGKVFASPFNADPATEWDSQFFIKSNESLPTGTKIHVKFRYRCTEERAFDTQAHGNPGEYHHWQFIGTLNATTEWQEHDFIGTISAEQAGDNGCSSIAFNLCKGTTAGTLYIDDVVFEKLISSNTIPLTPEEKYDILDAELDRWIKGMMDATKGKVKAWDVVNEALADTWGDIDLKHDPTGSDPNSFYWQDYLGDNFVRNVVKYARQHYAEQEGANPSDLLLFINDYNLEASYNNNDKCTSLVNWIRKWEADGETKIDGIGSQMHVSYSCNPEEQERRKTAVVRMLEILRDSGKLVRITELDMGIDDADGNAINTADVTLEQHKAMGEYYKFIITKYFEIIPVDQQFGICQWAQTDSPEGSGWRANSPIGLWNLNYQRKPAYGSFCEGLGSK